MRLSLLPPPYSRSLRPELREPGSVPADLDWPFSRPGATLGLSLSFRFFFLPLALALSSIMPCSFFIICLSGISGSTPG